MIVMMAPISQAGQNAENGAFKKRAIWVEFWVKNLKITCWGERRVISLSSLSLSARLGGSSFLCIFPLTFWALKFGRD